MQEENLGLKAFSVTPHLLAFQLVSVDPGESQSSDGAIPPVSLSFATLSLPGSGGRFPSPTRAGRTELGRGCERFCKPEFCARVRGHGSWGAEWKVATLAEK